MRLLRRIQDATIDPAYQLSDVLRMCKILAARLDYPDFKDWIENELNGYNGIENLPKYRVIKSLNCFGNFIGFHARLSNVQIPLSVLQEDIKHLLTTKYIRESIGSLVDCIALAHQNRQHSLYYYWPTGVRDYLHCRAYPNMECVGAWTVITSSHLAAILDTVKSKILDFVLEIEKIAPDAGEAQLGEKPLPKTTIQAIFNNCILNQTALAESSFNTHHQGGEMSNIDIKAEGSSTISGNAFNSEVKGVLAGGDVSGEVNYSITQLKESNTPYSEELADKLIQLKAIIEEDHNLPEPDKIEALEQVKSLAEVSNNPQPEQAKIAKGAIRMLKGIATELPTATKLVEGLNQLLPAIATLLGLG